jgi:hypothetical protein
MADNKTSQFQKLNFGSYLFYQFHLLSVIFIYFYRQRKKLSLHHHLTLVLVTISFIQMTTDFPFHMIYYHYGVVVSVSNIFCSWWNWCCFSLINAPIFAMAWGSCERHLLIFHHLVMDTRRK